MNNPHSRPTAVPANIAPDAAAAAEWLRTRGLVRIASIGPVGTSAHGVLEELKRHYPAEEESLLQVQLCPSFEIAAEHVLDGVAEYALIPSAYRNATSFHWSPNLELACIFVHRTPDYGLAVRRDAKFEDSEAVVVATMPEVENLFLQLAPDHIAGLPREFRMAASTSEAAAIVSDGVAHIAVCNDLGRREHDLSWINRRVGAEMVWMLFKRSKA